ncbi:DUF7503 family protein [Halocatena pleomorpha]|nr:hypothetical protein [Halocatena pleomorpha]
MSDSIIVERLAEHPKLTTAIFTVLVVLSQSGVAVARNATFPGP